MFQWCEHLLLSMLPVSMLDAISGRAMLHFDFPLYAQRGLRYCGSEESASWLSSCAFCALAGCVSVSHAVYPLDSGRQHTCIRYPERSTVRTRRLRARGTLSSYYCIVRMLECTTALSATLPQAEDVFRRFIIGINTSRRGWQGHMGLRGVLAEAPPLDARVAPELSVFFPRGGVLRPPAAKLHTMGGTDSDTYISSAARITASECSGHAFSKS